MAELQRQTIDWRTESDAQVEDEAPTEHLRSHQSFPFGASFEDPAESLQLGTQLLWQHVHQ